MDTLHVQQDVGGKIIAILILNVVTHHNILKMNLLFWKEMIRVKPARVMQALLLQLISEDFLRPSPEWIHKDLFLGNLQGEVLKKDNT